MKKLVGLFVTLAFMSMPVAFVAAPMLNKAGPEFIGYKPDFIGQDTAEVGELVRFLAEGEIVRWECLPETLDSDSYGKFNENYHVSFRKPGNYTIIAAIYSEGELTIHTQAVVVEGSAPPLPPPPVKPPTHIVPVKLNMELVKKVTGWATKYGIDRDTCFVLSGNFEVVAARIETGELITPGQIINATANLNSDLKLNEGLMAELQAYLTSQSDMGSLKTPDQHLIVWNSIAKGLKDAIH